MREGWISKKLSELSSIELGKTPARDNVKYWDTSRTTGNVWLSIADLLRANDSIVNDSKEHISDEGALLCKPVKSGTLLVSFKLTLGRLAFAGRNLYTNEAIAALNIKDEIILSKYFLRYYLQYFDWDKATEGDHKIKGRTFNKAKLKEIDVPFPPLPEQRRIVAILDEAFEGIATAKANAEKNLQNAREVFESHLNAVFSQRGEGWVEKRLGDVCRRITVGHVGPMAKRYKSNGIPFLRSQNIRPFSIDLDNVVFIDEAFHSSLAKSSLEVGDIAIVRTGYPGTAAVIPESLGIANCSDLVIVRPGIDIDAHFLAAFFNSQYGKQLVLGKIVGAAQKHFNVSAAKETVIYIPPVTEQLEIIRAANEMREETQHLESLYQHKLAALDELKQSLLHQAFNGGL
ncbi:restriction endonuclease subunit S [Acidithiobacillus thiooxidans]|uniref:restriction endonuclease subunit S n=1 Tax=Acidithiobacillus thiooxidans TaxID=930 RepID=UPI00242B92D4|nr:restriction endonuclease subunit S [Acidithiobacillus thiooxidans]